MPTPGAVTHTADQIRMTIDALRDIAHSKLPGLQSDAALARDRFRSLQLPSAAFSDYPQAQAVGSQHEGAHEVFVDTINGVIDDLAAFEQRLRDSVASAEATDEQVESAMVALGNSLSQPGHAFASARGYQRGNRAHDEELSTGEAFVERWIQGPSGPSTTSEGSGS
jgi:hypothetical protein